MAAAIALPDDYDSAVLRELAKQSGDADQVHRLRGGGWRRWIADLPRLGTAVQRRNVEGPVNGKALGQAPRLDQTQREELAKLVKAGPIPAVHGVVRWRLCDLAQWVMETYRTSISERTLSRYLLTMRYRTLSARPRHHAQNAEAVEAFKTYGPPRLQALSAI